MSTLNTTNLKHASSTDANIELKSNGGVGNLLVSNPGALNYIEVGHAQTGDHSAYMDFVGDTTYSDYGLRFIRNGGANSNSKIEHRGTGNLEIQAFDAGGQTVISKYAPQIPQALVSFNGGATSSIYCSHNVSSVTDNGTGTYTVNFTTALINNAGNAQTFPMMLLQSNGPVNGAHCHTWMYSIGSTSCGVIIYNDENSSLKADGNPVSVAVYG